MNVLTPLGYLVLLRIPVQIFCTNLKVWHGGTGFIEQSERGSLSVLATHDVFTRCVCVMNVMVMLCYKRD